MNFHPKLVDSESPLITLQLPGIAGMSWFIFSSWLFTTIVDSLKKKKKSLQHSKIGRNWDWLLSSSQHPSSDLLLKGVGMGGKLVGGGGPRRDGVLVFFEENQGENNRLRVLRSRRWTVVPRTRAYSQTRPTKWALTWILLPWSHATEPPIAPLYLGQKEQGPLFGVTPHLSLRRICILQPIPKPLICNNMIQPFRGLKFLDSNDRFQSEILLQCGFQGLKSAYPPKHIHVLDRNIILRN